MLLVCVVTAAELAAPETASNFTKGIACGNDMDCAPTEYCDVACLPRKPARGNCTRGEECVGINGCGYDHATARVLLCCPAGRAVRVVGTRPSCTNIQNGAPCVWSILCASRRCLPANGTPGRCG